MENRTLTNHENGNDTNRLLDAVVSDMDIETAAVNAYKGKDLNEQRENIDKILAFEKGAKWALSKLSNNGSLPIQCDYCGLEMLAGYDCNGKRYCYDCKHNGA